MSTQEQLDRNLRRLLGSWRDRRSALKGAALQLLSELESQLSSVVMDGGLSHLVSARRLQMTWSIVPRVVMVHHEGGTALPGVVHDYDGDEHVLLVVECTAGCIHVGVPSDKGTKDDPIHWTPASSVVKAQTLACVDS